MVEVDIIRNKKHGRSGYHKKQKHGRNGYHMKNTTRIENRPMVEKHNIRKNNTPLIINLPMVEEDMISYVGTKKGRQ